MLQRLVDLLRDLTQTPPPCDAGKCKGSTRKLGEAVPTSPAQTIYIISKIVTSTNDCELKSEAMNSHAFRKKNVFHSLSLTNPFFWGEKNGWLFVEKPRHLKRKIPLRIAPRHHDVQHGIIPLLREIFIHRFQQKNREL